MRARPRRVLPSPRLALDQRREQEHGPSLRAGKPRLHPCAARVGRLDHHGRQRDARHHRVAHREAAAARRGVRPELRDRPRTPRRSGAEGLAFWGGYERASPVPITATVRPPRASAAVWAAVSMPAASPETTVYPRSTRCSAIARARSMPASVALRAPTTAIACASAGVRRAGHEHHRRPVVDRAEVGRIAGLEHRDQPHAVRASSARDPRAPDREAHRAASWRRRRAGSSARRAPPRAASSSSSTAAALPRSSTSSAYSTHGRLPVLSRATIAARSSAAVTARA